MQSRSLAMTLLATFLAAPIPAAPAPDGSADPMDSYRIGPAGKANVKYPGWFKESFLDLASDLDDARQAGKRGVMLFVSAKNCNHCQAFLDTTFSDPATLDRVRAGYDVIGLDVFSDLEITDVDGATSPVSEFVTAQKARLTPTLLIYGAGEKARLLRLVGFYPPERFNHVLDYLEQGHFRTRALGTYLREVASTVPGAGPVRVDHAVFERPPYAFDRSRIRAQRPLLVVFDRPGCSACARFRRGVLSNPEVRALLPSFDAVHLDASDLATPLVTPDGAHSTPARWAAALQLEYDVSVVFFDESGREVHRLDAETRYTRMRSSMQYVLAKAYKEHENMQRWTRSRHQQARPRDG